MRLQIFAHSVTIHVAEKAAYTTTTMSTTLNMSAVRRGKYGTVVCVQKFIAHFLVLLNTHVQKRKSASLRKVYISYYMDNLLLKNLYKINKQIQVYKMYVLKFLLK